MGCCGGPQQCRDFDSDAEGLSASDLERFGGDDIDERLAAIGRGPPPVPTRRDGVPVWLADALRKGMALDPGRRHASMEALVHALTKDLRSGDLAARIGGDEFALWLEEVDVAGARARAERLLAAAAAILQRHSASAQQPLTLSIGVALLQPDHGETFEDLLARADAAMYRAKSDGKGRITFAQPPSRGRE